MDPKSIFDCIDFKTMLWPSCSTVLMVYSHFVPTTGLGRVPKRIQNPSPIHPAFLFRAVQLFSICFRVAQWIQKPSLIASILIHSNRWCLLSPRTYSEHASPCAPKQRPKFPDSVLRLASAQSPQRTNDCFSLRVAWKMMRNPNQTLSVPKPRSVKFRFGFVVLSGFFLFLLFASLKITL